jgi:glycosyltransferase involved in cell wall biosynthesis
VRDAAKVVGRPVVSVVLPVYNGEDFVAESVQSVLQQTIADLELIVVDDGSTDSTAAVVAAIDDPRVVIESGPNRGPSYARNRGMGLSRADWVAIIDADDWWAPDRLERLLELAANEPADMIADDLVIVDDSGQSRGTFFEEIGLDLREPTLLDTRDFVEGRIAGHRTARPGILKPLFRRGFLERPDVGYAEDVRGPEDWLFYCEALLGGATILIAPIRGYFYCRRSDSLSLGDPLRFIDNEQRAIRRLAKHPSLPADLQPLLSEWLADTDRQAAFHRLRQALRGGRLTESAKVVRATPAAAGILRRHVTARARVKLAAGSRVNRARRSLNRLRPSSSR